MYCTDCGAENAATSRFCLKCGTSLEQKSVQRTTGQPSRKYHTAPAHRPATSAPTLGGIVGMVGGALAILGWLMPWFRIAAGLNSPFGSLFELDVSIGSGLQLSLLTLAGVFAGLDASPPELGVIMIALLLLAALVAIPIQGLLNVRTGIRLFENRSSNHRHTMFAIQEWLTGLRRRSTIGFMIMAALFALLSLIPFLSSFLGGGFYLTAGAFALTFVGALFAKSQVGAP